MYFAELSAKSNFSFLEGASHPEEMVEQAVLLGYDAIAITDTDGVYALPRAFLAARERGIPLLYGAELTVEGTPLTLLAQNREGYGDLCELLTDVHCLEREATVSELAARGQNLVLLFPVGPSLPPLLPKLLDPFGDRLYLVASVFQDGRDRLRREAIETCSARYRLPCIASNMPLFHLPERKALQDVLRCIRLHCTLEEGGYRLLGNTERYLRPKEILARVFPDHPEWLERTREIVDRCRFSLDELRYHYPNEWIPAGETTDGYLAKLVWEGARKRYGNTLPAAVRSQIEKELTLIRDLAYADYFLTTWDIVRYARSRGILCQGRGSAANSITCYVLEITAIDPIRMNLLFERFLSRERKEPPDIDIDFEHERREEVIQYIYERYGRHRAAITAEVICYRRKSALRDVGKAFGIPVATVEDFLRLTHRRSLDEIGDEAFLALAPMLSPRAVKLYLRLAREILAFPRHIGTHVGGFVLTHDKLTRSVPIEKAAMPGRTIVQWDKNDLDALGFVRVDVLGLGMLTAIRKSFEGLEKTYGLKYDLASVPAEDPKVYDQICRADTVGVFQIESRAQMNMLPRLKPRNFFDLVVEISLVRPGPIQGDMVHPYLKRRAGKEKIDFLHPSLRAILEKTYGVPIFQEQVMKMAMEVAGFSAGAADNLRRAMGTWRKDGTDRLARIGARFQEGMIAHGIEKDFAARVFSQIEGFAEYGFPESHAASFAILAYVSAFLKHYHPDVFLMALLNSQPMGFYSSHSLIHDAKRHGVHVVDVDVRHSRWDSMLERPGLVRLGLREIRGLPERTGRAIEGLRGTPMKDLPELARRLREALSPVPLTKRELFLLASANAFRSMGKSRREALWEIQALSIQDSHYLPHPEEPTALPSESAWERVSYDYQSRGVSLYAHPIALFRPYLDRRGCADSREVDRLVKRDESTPGGGRSRRRVRVGGVVICRQMPPTATGVLFITLEDEHGFINLVIWRKVYEKFRNVILSHSFLLVEGRLERPADAYVAHVIVDTIAPLLAPEETRLPSHDFH